ncbi:hypothetical protein [Streptomyces sp. ISL-87]|uniref:hypothetical protein n=1 Tax=unclassified Streptomyces TaxID=2593676 RepID=UPI0035ABCA72
MSKRGPRFGQRAAGQAARMPFVLLVVALLGGGLISLLLLNSALNQGSFQLTKLKKETTALTDEEQALQRDVDGYSAPDALQRRAHELGLVPGGSPVFIGPDGKITGTAAAASEPPPPSAPPTAAQSPAGPAAQAAPPSGSAAQAAPSGGGAGTATPSPAQNAPQSAAPADSPQGAPAAPTATPQPSQTPGR